MASDENTDTISDYLESSKFYTQTDDSLKDEDNAAWIMELPEYEIKKWVSVLHWVRLADRLLEWDRLQMDKSVLKFSKFLMNWKNLRIGENFADSEHAKLFEELSFLWKDQSLNNEDLEVWDLYLESLELYTRPGIVIHDMQEYETALYGLSGTFFLAFPEGPRKYKKEIGVLGTLDQFYNNLRDLYEDSVRGLYYFPETLLEQFGIKRGELSRLVVEPDERFVRMNEFLLESFAGKLKASVAHMVTDENLPASWQIMIKNNFKRYARIENVFRKVGYNSLEFSMVYWDHVRVDIDPKIREKFRNFKSTLKI
ncbi:MAG: hypothetical protein HYT71_01720 [Candidatus Aenigmarchaeota archaeon]|nr:hypothetical protein [Candidatus Aenigmarchaeota archaeon]